MQGKKMIKAMAAAAGMAAIMACSTAGSAIAAGAVDRLAVGGDRALWNEEGGAFDQTVMDELVGKLFGDDDAIGYIKSGWDEATQSFVIPAPAIAEKAGGEDLTVRLGGRNWLVASLTVAEIDGEENAVATLYLADNITGTTVYYNNANDVKGINMYSRSTLRKALLGDKSLALFTDGREDGFAQRYLVQPKYISYQQTETMFGRDENWYNCPNDALGSLTDGWYKRIEYQPGYTMNAETVRYEDWGEDYIWIPSITETGANNGAADKTCIWKLSAEQRSHNPSPCNYSWFRSGNLDYFNRAYILHKDGRYYNELVTNTYGIRPAIHLNLSAAALGTRGAELDDPEDVTSSFNGERQSLTDLAASPFPAWYRKSIYSDEDKVKVEYEGTAQKAGKYRVKVTLLDSWIEKEVLAAEAWCDEAGLSGEARQAYIARKTPKFGGEPDTSDTAHPETDRVRWLTHTIGKRRISVPEGGSLVYSGEKQTYLPASFNEKYMKTVGDPTGIGAGEYSYMLSLVYPEDSEWADGSVGEKQIDWTMEQYKLVAKWNYAGDYPRFVLPAAFADTVLTEYVYYGEDGREVAEDALRVGQTYRIVAVLKGDGKDNFAFVDATGAVLSDPERSEPVEFVNKTEGSGVTEKGAPVWQIATGCAAAVAVAAAVAATVVLTKKRRRAKTENQDDKS